MIFLKFHEKLIKTVNVLLPLRTRTVATGTHTGPHHPLPRVPPCPAPPCCTAAPLSGMLSRGHRVFTRLLLVTTRVPYTTFIWFHKRENGKVVSAVVNKTVVSAVVNKTVVSDRERVGILRKCDNSQKFMIILRNS